MLSGQVDVLTHQSGFAGHARKVLKTRAVRKAANLLSQTPSFFSGTPARAFGNSLRMRSWRNNMAAIKDGSGITKRKRRAWGKQRCKPDLVSIDHMDIELLTKVVEKQSYADGDLQNPEGMATETLVAHLSRMNIAYPNSTRSREGLLYLFRVHIQPKTQRNRFWRRKRRREEVEVGDTWTTGMDCDNRTRKR